MPSCIFLTSAAGRPVLNESNRGSGAAHYDHCDPLDTTLCALPFPSSFFLEETPLSAPSSSSRGTTGYRVSFGPESLPFTRGRKNVSPVALNAYDGFSTLAPILFYLEVGGDVLD